MSLTATYIGAIPHLVGERAQIRTRPSRAWLGAPEHILSRSIFAQFNSMDAQKKRGAPGRSEHKHLGFGWHRFDVRDFKLDEDEIAEVECTCTACPSQFEGRLANGAYFYARYRSARIRIGIDGTLAMAVDRALDHHPDVSHTRRSVSQYAGYMTWDEMLPWMVKAIASYRESTPDWSRDQP